MANVFLISSRNRRSMRTTTESKPKNLTVKRSDSSSDYNYSCKKHPKHRQSPGICSLCLNESLSKLSSEFYDYSSSMSSSSLAKTMSSCSSASSESESDFSSTAISSYYSSVSSCLSPLQHRYSEIVVNKKKRNMSRNKASSLDYFCNYLQHFCVIYSFVLLCFFSHLFNTQEKN
ncbi:hypothetical protein AtEden1_Chr1g0025041 [Arabidopsis thaliana]